MRLEKRFIDVKKVVFDDKTFVENGVLHVSKKELEDVAMDYRFKSVDRLIGLNKSFRIKGDLKGPLTASINVIRESISQLGNTNLTTVVY